MISTFLFLLGLAFGSFLNVLTLRYDPDKKYTLKTAGGRSQCPHCHKKLVWYELLPLASFAIQKGKCRSCGAKLSWQYPLVELISGILFAAIPYLLGRLMMGFGDAISLSWTLPAFSAFWIVTFMMLMAAFIIDVRHFVIPNMLNLALFVMGLGWTAAAYFLKFSEAIGGGSFLGYYAPLFAFSENALVSHAIGAAIAAFFFIAIVLVSRGRGMGIGDVKLIGALGMLFGWPDVGAIILMSFIIGTVALAPLLLVRRKKMGDRIPFGPFIVIAAAIIFFAGTGLLGAYFGIIQGISL
jgi:prepilin signal peptidase PulO-like enzyme (type II secretory pathway)